MMVLGSLDKFLLGRASTEYVEDVNDEPDDLAFVLTVVKNPAAVADVELFARLVAVMSVTLSDKRNAIVMRGTIVASVVEIARSCVKLKLAASVCIDCAKCIFRIASASSENRLHMIDTMPYLAAFLQNSSTGLQEVACACIQLLCTSSIACEALVTSNGVAALAALLYTGKRTVLAKALAALQTATRDLEVCRLLALHSAILPLMTLAHNPDGAVAYAAAGVLQNIGRDKDTCKALLDADVVGHMTPLLINDDPMLQSVAVGVILNTHTGDAESREVLKAVLAAVVAGEAIGDVMGMSQQVADFDV